MDNVAQTMQRIQRCPVFQFDGISNQDIAKWARVIGGEFVRNAIPDESLVDLATMGIVSEARERFGTREYPKDRAGFIQLLYDLRDEFTPARNEWYNSVRAFQWTIRVGESHLQFLNRFEELFVRQNPNAEIQHRRHIAALLRAIPVHVAAQLGYIAHNITTQELIARVRVILRPEQVIEAAEEAGPNVFREMAEIPAEEEDPEEFALSDVSDISYQEN